MIFIYLKAVINAQLLDSTRELKPCTILHYYSGIQTSHTDIFCPDLIKKKKYWVALLFVIFDELSNHGWDCAALQNCSKKLVPCLVLLSFWLSGNKSVCLQSLWPFKDHFMEVIRKSQERHEKTMRQSWESNEKFMRK